MNKIYIGFIVALAVGLVALGGAIAFRGNTSMKRANYDSAIQAQLETALEAGDYDSWMKIRLDNNLPTRGRIFQAVNRENFALYSEMHKANQAGDTAKADALRQELGIGMGQNKQGCQAVFGENKQGCQGNCQHAGFVDANNDGICDNKV